MLTITYKYVICFDEAKIMAEMTKEQVVDLMKSSTSENEWNNNCDKVKAAFGGYPSFWYSAVIMSGVLNKTRQKFGW